MSINDLENIIQNLEQILIHLQRQSVDFFPDQQFEVVDFESTVVAGAIKDIKTAKYASEFNNGISDLRLQQDILENRAKHLEQLFIKNYNAQVEEALVSVNLDILHTKKEIHNRRHQDVNIVLNENSNQLLEKYQLL